VNLKPIIKSFIGGTLRPFGKKITLNKLTVFCYHDVSNTPSEFSRKYNLNVPPDIFNTQINFISSNFNVISPDDLLSGNILENAAMITFDDGFRSYFTTAVPILKKWNLPSINFLNIGPIKGELFWAGLITYLCNTFNDFTTHVINNTKGNINTESLYLKCSRKIVNSYLNIKGNSYKTEVDKYVGMLATLQDLKSVSLQKLVYFGNHLYNHDVPLLLSDEELLYSYCKNVDELKYYPNYRSLFAFPFGQPNTCFSVAQIKLLLGNGADKVFSAYPHINSDANAKYLHRISMSSINNTSSKIWYSILKNSININNYYSDENTDST
jgi:hypothetical protein